MKLTDYQPVQAFDQDKHDAGKVRIGYCATCREVRIAGMVRSGKCHRHSPPETLLIGWVEETMPGSLPCTMRDGWTVARTQDEYLWYLGKYIPGVSGWTWMFRNLFRWRALSALAYSSLRSPFSGFGGLFGMANRARNML